MDLEREKALIEDVQSGNFTAFSQIYDHYYDKLLNYAWRRTLDRHASEDIVANAFMKMLDNINKFKWSDRGIAPWMYRIASNELSNYYRKRNRYRFIAEAPILELFAQNYNDEENEDAISDLAAAEEHQRVLEALDCINERYQRAIELRYFEEKSYAEMAQIFGIAETSVRSIVSRAVSSLKKQLNNYR